MRLPKYILSTISLIFLCVLCTTDFFSLHFTSTTADWINFILSICYIFWIFNLYCLYVVLSKKCGSNFFIKSSNFLFLVLIFFLLLPLFINSVYAICEHKTFSDTTVFLILQSNISEALGYLYSKVSLVLLITLSIYIILFIFLIINTSKLIKNSLQCSNKSLFIVVVVFALTSCILCVNKEHLLFFQSIKKGFGLYDEYRVLRQPDLEHLQVDLNKPSLGKHLIVIGESSNRDYWSLYNFKEKTTPAMDSLFQNCKSCVYVKLAYSTEKMTETSLAKTLTNYGQGGLKLFLRAIPLLIF